jgi:predicted metal-dependent phosphoesterase TrpH
MLGIYDNEELVERNYGAANAKLIQNDDDPGKRLIERIAAAKAEGTEQREGFTVEHAHNETQGQPAKADTPAAFSSEASSEPAVDAGAKAEVAEPAKTKKKKGAKDAEAPAAHQVEQVTGEPDHEVMPTNGTEWEVYAKVWIAALAANPNATKDDYNKRWKAETTLRNDCGITAEVRDRVYDMLLASRDDAKK